jgi:hypothetical protein
MDKTFRAFLMSTTSINTHLMKGLVFTPRQAPVTQPVAPTPKAKRSHSAKKI